MKKVESTAAAHEQGWEARCRRCGRCCQEKVEFEGRVYYTGELCNFLDPATRLCTVYPERHLRRSDCMPLTATALAQGILPADCPYVADLPDYNAPVLYDEEQDGCD